MTKSWGGQSPASYSVGGDLSPRSPPHDLRPCMHVLITVFDPAIYKTPDAPKVSLLHCYIILRGKVATFYRAAWNADAVER